MLNNIESQVVELAFEEGYEEGFFSKPNTLPGVPVRYTITKEREDAWQSGWEAGRQDARNERV